MIKRNKIGIIGLGHVGAHCAFTLIARGLADELVLVDQDRQKVVSERQDLMDALAYCPHSARITIGGYGDLGDCDILVNAIGKVSLLETHDRITELDFTIREVTEMIPQVMAGGFQGVIINITNPCDIITRQIAKLSGLPKGQVFGTGTGLDTSRLISAIHQQTGIAHQSITAYMLGEHGAAIMAPVSQISFRGKSAAALQGDERFRFDGQALKKIVHDGAWITFAGKKCTEYGICSTLARDVECVLRDQKAIMPVSTELDGQYGERDVFVGVPAVIGRSGVEEVLELDLTPEELEEFHRCCEGVRRNQTLNPLVLL